MRGWEGIHTLMWMRSTARYSLHQEDLRSSSRARKEGGGEVGPYLPQRGSEDVRWVR